MAQHILDGSLISAAAKDSLQRLPDELLQSILLYLSPHDAIGLGLTCRRFSQIIDAPLLWRHYCNTEYTYWKSSEETDERIQRQEPIAPWRQHFAERSIRDRQSKELFESALTSQRSRLEKLRQISAWEYESKAMLMENCNAPDDCEDVLARRYFAEATLGLINRTNALRIWRRLVAGEETSLEEQLAAFDLFVIGKHWGSVEDITQALDKIANDIKKSTPGVEEIDEVERSLTVIRHLQHNGHVGLGGGRDYRGMKNNYLSFNLVQGSNASLPLQSAVIFCSVARRLGINAHPCLYPAHIHVVVLLNDIDPSDLPSPENTVYLDPWSSDKLVPLSNLTYRLRMLGIGEVDYGSYLFPAPIREMCLRTCRNIMRSYQSWRRGTLEEEPPLMNHDAFYSFLWCMTLVEDGFNRAEDVTAWYRPHLTHLTPFFRDHYPEDWDLVNTYLTPLFGTHPQRQHFNATMEEMRQADVRERLVIPRGEHSKDVKFKIGQMLQHKRYGYIGVVRRWDPHCLASEHWIAEMGVEKLPNGRWQAFYDVLWVKSDGEILDSLTTARAEDRSQRYVAEENIEAIYSDPPAQLMQVAGRYFKRWDADERVFVSNVRDEYPDD